MGCLAILFSMGSACEEMRITGWLLWKQQARHQSFFLQTWCLLLLTAVVQSLTTSPLPPLWGALGHPGQA